MTMTLRLATIDDVTSAVRSIYGECGDDEVARETVRAAMGARGLARYEDVTLEDVEAIAEAIGRAVAESHGPSTA